MSMNTIPEALDELRAGHVIIVVDDPDRENEGDLICAAEFATQANVNLMASVAKGLICMPMSSEIAHKLNLEQMVSENTDNHETAFTVSIDHVSTTTGISAAERSITAMKCVDPDAKPSDFRRPGHMFPLVAKAGGVLERNGHTEATVDLMRHAGMKQCGLCCEIMREDGTMMRTTELMELARQRNLVIVSIKQLQDWCRTHDNHMHEQACVQLPTAFGTFHRTRLRERHHRRRARGAGEGRPGRRTRRAVPRAFRVPDRRRVRLDALRLRRAAACGAGSHRGAKGAACCCTCARKGAASG